ncbi:alpha/beta hydrolase [Paenarthrobacter sp. NPDC089675]|uniref:alpha/beta hydrolase n=1 Tax=Paenarthrobacter TaxID=1742992 RepID=UPI0037F4CFF6
MTGSDKYSSRPVAQDAAEILEKFRQSGGVPFHAYPVERVRELYESSCATNGLAGEELSSVSDFEIEEFRVRVYRPKATAEPGPALLFLHGGGWVMGSLATHDGLCRRLAFLTDLPVVAVDYRLAPEHPYPAAINDSRAALRWLLEASNGHQLNVTGVVLIGDSAGGQLAAVLANENASAQNPLPVAAQVLIYPMVDLTMASQSYSRVREGFPLVADTIAWFADHYLPGNVDRSSPEISPGQGQLPLGLPKTLIITVDNDPLVDEGAEYAAALAKAGTEVQYMHLPGYAHGLFTSAGRVSRGEKTITQIAEFISKAVTDHP